MNYSYSGSARVVASQNARTYVTISAAIKRPQLSKIIDFLAYFERLHASCLKIAKDYGVLAIKILEDRMRGGHYYNPEVKILF